MKKLVHKFLALFSLRVHRIPKMTNKVKSTQYFNTGNLTPLQENSLEIYDTFYNDELALEEYYEPGGYRMQFYKNVVDALVKEGVDFTDKKIVDVGCGIGFLLLQIQQNYKPGKLIGSDFSSKAVEFSKKKFPNMEFFCHDLNNPLPDKYDMILCTEVLEHLEKPYWAVKNMLNALNEGGSIVLTVPNGRYDSLIEHINFWSPESWLFFLQRECDGCKIKTSFLFDGGINFALIKKNN